MRLTCLIDTLVPLISYSKARLPAPREPCFVCVYRVGSIAAGVCIEKYTFRMYEKRDRKDRMFKVMLT